jgi:protein-tyrosine phosphatase
MSSFFKAKPKLSALLPPRYTDIHSHLLPGIDDGAKNIADTISLLQGMQKIGFSTCITTPHTLSGIWDNTKQSIQGNWLTTKEQLPDVLRNMVVGIASEYMLDDSILPLAANQELLCLKDAYVLVEMSYLHPPLGLEEILFDLRLKGYIPVLAHPERYFYYHQDVHALEKIKSAGCLFQLNLLSVTGYYGQEVVRFVDQLFTQELIDVTGSDIHHMQHIEAFGQTVKIRSVDHLEKAMQSNEMFRHNSLPLG